MSLDPRLTSYQIPYQPLFETTQQQIERSLFSLEQKLRKRKQIDLQLSSAVPPPSYPRLEQLYYQQALANIEERQRAHRSIAQQQLRMQQVSAHEAHLLKMEQLRLERDQLAREASYSVPLSVYQMPMIHVSSPSDDQLIRKYQDGSKAKEYYHDLDLQLQRQEIQEIRKARIQAQQQYQSQERLKGGQQNKEREVQQTDRKSHQKVSFQDDRSKLIQATPYDRLLLQTRQKNEPQRNQNDAKGHVVKDLQKQFEQAPQRHYQSSIKLPSYEQSTFRTSSPVKLLKTPNREAASPYKQRMTRYKSVGKMPCNRSRSNLSPHRTSRLQGSYLQARGHSALAKPSIKDIELNAIKKIQNRLKVSKVIYEDSQFRNNKYEVNHLFNTYDIESRCRRQIKDKLNNHPLVLRKHALTVE